MFSSGESNRSSRVLVLIPRCMILYAAFPFSLKLVAHLFDFGVGMHLDIHPLACGLLRLSP